MRTVILGWGSLLWDDSPAFAPFNAQKSGPWRFDGPNLSLEFSRVSASRANALTLVIEPAPHGSQCAVAYVTSKRESLDDAICDLRCREGTTLANIGFCLADPTKPARSRSGQVLDEIRHWLKERGYDAAVWTDLSSNFPTESNPRADFSVPAAKAHLMGLAPAGKAKAAEYIWRAPPFVKTPLLTALEAEPWFTALKPV